jgi:hypothetical protein
MKRAINRLAGLMGLLGATLAIPAQVSISEFMANNNKTLRDRDGEYSDWIEIHNAGGVSVSLSGWYLTDSRNLRAKWQFPAVTLAPNGYLLVFASGKDRAVAGTELHTNFRLDAGGEYLALVMPDAVTVASDFNSDFPEQFADISYGEYQGTNYYFARPTPGSANAGAGFIAAVANTKFSHDRGFYDAPFDLTIRTATTNAVIRYTLNGLPPSLTNGMVYTTPIRISGTTTLRAAAFKTGHLPSSIDTQTYIFLDDVIRQASDGQPPSGWPSSWGANVRDYGMDPDVVNNPLYSGTIKNDLKSLPSFSIVMDLKDLFDPTRGIYANAGQQGRAWERPTSLELIYPERKTGFQINGGIRIRGGFSRSSNNPKHAFRLFFRDKYGAPKLKYPLFGDAGTDSFDNIDLRTFQNYSWSFQGDANGVFLRDQFSRDAQLAMGHQSERGNFYHLYLNGQYWGLFNTCERPEASYAETYFGGNKEDYDVIKVETGPYALVATDGNMTAWTQLYNTVKAGVTDEVYWRIQGRNPDGTRNPNYPVWLDVPNLIDYMLVILYGGNLDAPISNFLSNTSPNNWYGIRNRNGTEGFRFFAHDAEHTLLNVNQDRTGPYPAGDSSVTKSSPQWIWQKLQASAEFRMLMADHTHRHFFNRGVLTPETARAMFLARKAEIDRAVVGESARWGDAKRATPLTRDAHWVPAINTILNNYLPRRTGIVLNQLKAKNLYPNVTAPSFSQHGGGIQPGFSLTMSAPAGTIYYTRDGSDPRLIGGAVSSSASVYSSPLTLNESAHIRSRALSGGVWSALNEAPFTIIQTFTDLLITEIMYNPPSQDGIDGDEFEFIELKNVSGSERDLSGIHFTDGVVYAFPSGTKLGSGQFVVLVSNPTEFQKRYPGVRVTGSYRGRLSNGGETLTLVHAAGAPITSIAYGDQAPWPGASDGVGFSLVPVNPNLNPNPNDPANWRASARPGGSPGADDPAATINPVFINEVLTHTDLPAKDAIELYNPNASAVDISNWYLTDSRMTPKKFRTPPGTVIPARAYLVFNEDQFNRTPGVEPSFNLSSHGEEVYLYSADSTGNLTGFSDGFGFGAAQNGVSFGRFTNSVGEVQYPAQLANTLGTANAGPRIGPVVISEIHYQPAPDGDEFIELKNITPRAVKLYDPAHATNSWRLNGVGFDFPANVEIPPNGLALIVATDPGVFRSKYGVPASVTVFGPFSGSLQDSGELLRLQMPDEPHVELNGQVVVPYIDIDAVRYNDKAPWPTNAAGFGPSLERINVAAYANDPSNWRASPGPPSPGVEGGGNRAPQVNAGADLSFQSGNFPFTANLSGSATDDGLPNPPKALTVTWTQVSGPGAVTFANARQLKTAASFPGVGTYVLRLTASDGAVQTGDEISVTLERPPAQVTFVPAGSVWRYLDNGSDQGTAWRAPSFNDSAWRSGRAQLGYGDGDEATVIQGGPSTARFVTTYFRRTFTAANASSVTRLTVRLVRDDGAIVYLNGTEVFRSNMPEGAVTYQTYASSVVGDADESAFFEREIDESRLVEGNNVLAVELHQANATSSDTSFDLELIALSIPKNQPPIVNAGPDLTIQPAASATLNASVSDDGLPIPPGRLTITWTQVTGPGQTTFGNPNAASTAASFNLPGTYVLRLRATDGELTAQDDVTVTVEDGTLAAWKAQYFNSAELGNPSISGDNADPDNDRHTNIQEYIAGTNPKDSQSVLKLISIQLNSASPKLQFMAVAGKTYTIQFRDELGGAPWQKLTDVPAPRVSQAVKVTDPNPSRSVRYYRVVTPGQ